MNRNFLSFLLASLFFVSSFNSYGQEKVSYTLQEIVARAKAQSTAALRAQTNKENSFWRYRVYKSDFNPQLRLRGTIPSYSQSVNSVTQPDGSIEFREVKQNMVELGLGLEQVIAPTGGMLSVNSSSNRFDNFLAPEGLRARYSGVPV